MGSKADHDRGEHPGGPLMLSSHLTASPNTFLLAIASTWLFVSVSPVRLEFLSLSFPLNAAFIIEK